MKKFIFPVFAEPERVKYVSEAKRGLVDPYVSSRHTQERV